MVDYKNDLWQAPRRRRVVLIEMNRRLCVATILFVQPGNKTESTIQHRFFLDGVLGWGRGHLVRPVVVGVGVGGWGYPSRRLRLTPVEGKRPVVSTACSISPPSILSPTSPLPRLLPVQPSRLFARLRPRCPWPPGHARWAIRRSCAEGYDTIFRLLPVHGEGGACLWPPAWDCHRTVMKDRSTLYCIYHCLARGAVDVQQDVILPVVLHSWKADRWMGHF